MRINGIPVDEDLITMARCTHASYRVTMGADICDVCHLARMRRESWDDALRRVLREAIWFHAGHVHTTMAEAVDQIAGPALTRFTQHVAVAYGACLIIGLVAGVAAGRFAGPA